MHPFYGPGSQLFKFAAGIIIFWDHDYFVSQKKADIGINYSDRQMQFIMSTLRSKQYNCQGLSLFTNKK